MRLVAVFRENQKSREGLSQALPVIPAKERHPGR
jgi:hypothetical protein